MFHVKPGRTPLMLRRGVYVAGMVTKIHRSAPKRLFLKEHREAKGISAEQMAGRLDITRESLYRLEREPRRVNSEKQAAYAEALQIEPADLWSHPGTPSLDALVSSAPQELRAMAADIVRRLVSGKG